MRIIDLKYDRGKLGRDHFKIDIDGMSICYCYIRKNASSAFKKLFIESSRHQKHPTENDMQFLLRNHSATLSDVKSADYRICVLRDPVARSISLYQNKFIKRSGNADIFKSYEALTGQQAHQASFSDFVDRYLSLPLNKLDPHAFSQVSHLMPVHYNAAFMIDELGAGISSVIGSTRANRYFSQKVNSTAGVKEIGLDQSQKTADELCEAGWIPGGNILCTDKLAQTIREAYAEDFDLLTKLTNYKSRPFWWRLRKFGSLWKAG